MPYRCYEVLLVLISCFTIAFFAAPTLVAAASLQIGWIDNSSNEDGFNIERKLGAGGTFSLIAMTGPNATSYSDNNLVDGTTYCYRVNAFNGAGASTYTNEACGTTSSSIATTPPSTSPPATPPPPVSSTVTAVLLGQTGEDIAGTTSQTHDGIKDVHIRLSGVQNSIIGVRITDGGSGVWQTPFNGQNWIVAIRPEADASIVDLFFDGSQSSSSYTVLLTFADGSSQTIQTSMAGTSAVQPSSLPTTTTLLSNSNSSTATQSTLVLNAVTQIGVFRPDTGEWFLDRSANGQWDGCAVDVCVKSFGQAGDVAVTRKMGFNATLIGIFRQGIWIFDSNKNGALDNCSVDECDSFGVPGDLPVTGDWNGSGTEGIGVFRPSTKEWFLDINGNGQWDGCHTEKCLGPFGADGDLPITGDWDATGKVRIGVYRPSTGEWFLDANGNGQWDGCDVDKCLGPFGADGDLPIVGDWNGTGKTSIGVYRPSTGDWFLDVNGNGNFDGCAVDVCLGPFGQAGDAPVVGQW